MDNPRKKIYLIGFMGSGKTTLGKRLAAQLSWSFIDLDKVIETRTGLKITEIFSSRGEDFFRSAESEALRSLEGGQQIVVSTGGGTPCSDNNMNFMNESGLTIYLKLSPEKLYSRLAASTGGRPLLKDVPAGELRDFIVKKLAEREKCYSKASWTINGECDTISGLVTQVKNWIQE